MKKELQDQLIAATVKLCSGLDPDSGLFGHLVSTGTLTDEQIETCKAKDTKYQKVDAILTLLKRQPDDSYYKFCEALSAIGRKDLCDHLKQLAGNHIVIPPSISSDRSIPTGNGNIQNPPAAAASNQKMVSFEDAFKGKGAILTKKLNLGSGLVTYLRDFGLLTKDDADEIDHSMKTNAEKVKCLLDKLLTRDDSEFPLFERALTESNQPHIMKLLNLD